MFDSIIVAEELLPIRNAAGQGDIDAMFALADHVVKGKHTRQSGKIANQIIGEMYKRDDFSNNYTRAWNTYVLNVCALKLMQLEGEISYRQYIEDSCDYLQYMIDSMTSAPRQMWNYEQLENCIAWIRENEPKLREETL